MSQFWQASYTHKDYEIVSDEVKYDGYFKVLNQTLRFKMYDGNWSRNVKRDRIIQRKAVAVLLYHPGEDSVLLVEQFRAGAVGHSDEINSPWLLEAVAGMIEYDDSKEETAIREAKEETGCEVLDLIPICKYLSSPGITNELVYVLCGRINNYNKEKNYGLISESEDIKLHIFPVKEAFQLIKNNNMLAASGVIALQWLQINIDFVRHRWGKA